MKKKKKAAIITIVDMNNYGNRLQNYAACEVLKQMDLEPITLQMRCCPISKISIQRWNHFMEERLPVNDGKLSLTEKRIYNFRKFTKQYINTKIFFFTKYYDLKRLSNKYDYFVIGSDQIWNPLLKLARSYDFATFARPEQKVCMAPSFGTDVIPENDRERIAGYLKTMENIAVREEAGLQIVKELTGNDATVMIDPTMLLSQERWLKIAKTPKFSLNRKYVLTYFLGECSNVNRQKIRKIKEEHHLDEIELLNPEFPEVYISSPDEFLGLIAGAELICTDSFHGCVFSILFRKPFIAFMRDGSGAGMSSRLETLLSKFGLTSRYAENTQPSSLFTIDYTQCFSILEAEKQKSLEYLRSVLNNR